LSRQLQAAHDGGAFARRAGRTTVAGLFFAQLKRNDSAIAVEQGALQLSYAALGDRVLRLAGALVARGVLRGDRLAILSENRLEFLEVFLAAASIGAVVACQNWRLARPEIEHCVGLAAPKLAFTSERYAEAMRRTGRAPVVFGPAYEALLAGATPLLAPVELDPEDPLLILYTSGTTGLPKGAVISHRAEIARNLVVQAEFGVRADDTFVAWSPLYHMGGADYSLGTLMSGGKVIVLDGFDRERLAEIVRTEQIGWLILMPGMVSAFATELEERHVVARGIRLCGVMADLVPRAEIARITKLLGAPYANTFGATETGCPPCSSNLIPVGVAPERLSKELSRFCEVRLVDPDDHDVPDGSPGELIVRGPTLFSGYFRAPEVNDHEFRGGYYHMGDVFVRNPDRTLDFVDRVKYLIKSGGENIYPAEIERVLLSDPRVLEACVIRAPDEKWGEVPIVFLARNDDTLGETELKALCRASLAGYKQPKAFHFIGVDEFPRSASGKIQRHELEKRRPP
jgi:acyl-CoA synthetase (AMP-forming)/AMP-acid ligase II